MKRTKPNPVDGVPFVIKRLPPDVILTSDWHLREDQPTCRTDDFQKAQWKKVDFISDLQKKYDCMVLCAGDVYEYWKPSPNLLSETIKHLPKKFCTILGNHDLPQHNLDLAYKSGVYTLFTGGHLMILEGCHWGEIPDKNSFTIPCPIDSIKLGRHAYGYSILIYHIMPYQGTKPWPDCTDPMAAKLLRKYPQYDLILPGHNQQSLFC